MLARGLILSLLVLQVGVAWGEDIETRRERRERERMELLLESLVKKRGKPELTYFSSANAPIRCAEIEYYLRKTAKTRAVISELALVVEAHDSKLTPTRVYRVKYEDRKGEHEHDFIMQQHGADWRVEAHVSPVELPKPPPQPQPLPPQTLPPVAPR
jgi:hypothetical protein